MMLRRLVLAFSFASLVACAPSATPSSTPSIKTANATTPTGTPTGDGSFTHVTQIQLSPALRAIVDAPDRDADDKKLDEGRKPGELLAFAGINSGMKVAELAAGGGYTTELLARAVGPTGVVYGQNSPTILEKFAEKPWAARLAKPVNKNVVKVTRDFDDPLPPEAKDLDAVVMVLFYHDTYWMNVDRAKMNANILRALKPGGKFIIVDHSARAGTGSTEVKTLHRVDEALVRDDLTHAGFRLATDADFLRNPYDKRDWNASPTAAAEKRGTSDRFVLGFVKP